MIPGGPHSPYWEKCAEANPLFKFPTAILAPPTGNILAGLRLCTQPAKRRGRSAARREVPRGPANTRACLSDATLWGARLLAAAKTTCGHSVLFGFQAFPTCRVVESGRGLACPSPAAPQKEAAARGYPRSPAEASGVFSGRPRFHRDKSGSCCCWFPKVCPEEMAHSWRETRHCSLTRGWATGGSCIAREPPRQRQAAHHC